jgi:hypothetical protein
VSPTLVDRVLAQAVLNGGYRPRSSVNARYRRSSSLNLRNSRMASRAST